MKIAGAPISWGVCEVPGWGHQLSPDRVLGEMHDLGLHATELGPPGWLPSEPQERAAVLKRFGLEAVGGFVPLVLHDPEHDPLPFARRELEGFVATGAEVLIVSADSGAEGYDSRAELDEEGWTTLLTNLQHVIDLAARRGITTTLHPHVGTMVEGPEEIARVLDSSIASLCLDTGHLLIGGTDPLELCRHHARRINHVHVKDVRFDLVAAARAGEISYSQAVHEGIYPPLGDGDVDFAGIVEALERAGFDGWYVIEQDIALAGEPNGRGPAGDVRRSLDFLSELEPNRGQTNK